MSTLELASTLPTYYSINTAAKACVQYTGDLSTNQMNFMTERVHAEGMAFETGLCSDHTYLKKINYARSYGTLATTIWIA